MSLYGGWYCPWCGAIERTPLAELPGPTHCFRCSAPGLARFEYGRPVWTACPVDGCEERVWIDGFNDFAGQHDWRHGKQPAAVSLKDMRVAP